MEVVYFIAGTIGIALIVYLIIALLKPEFFL